MVGFSNAVAAGLMLGASFGLVSEGIGHGEWETLGGVFVGVVFILAGAIALAGFFICVTVDMGLTSRWAWL